MANNDKCDESRPACMRCQRSRRPCSYVSAKNDHSLPPTSVTFARTPVSNCSRNGTPTLHLLKHVLENWTAIFHVPGYSQIMAISKSSPLVENTILTIAACHLRHISPVTLQHRIAEHFQQSQVLHDLRITLQTPPKDLGQSGADAVMLSAMLLNIIAFALPEFQAATSVDPQTSWVFSTNDDRLGWLDLQVALRPLLHSMNSYLESTLSLLGPIFLVA